MMICLASFSAEALAQRCTYTRAKHKRRVLYQSPRTQNLKRTLSYDRITSYTMYTLKLHIEPNYRLQHRVEKIAEHTDK